ncbi:hypothetical protein VB757_07535 [Synechococcus sp. BA-132 BA5]|nr:hypothetical protein [Synechococcus sp. BA-132 BA5]
MFLPALRFVVPLGGLALALAVPSAARAGSCEDTFAQVGNPLSGIRFNAAVTVDDLSVPVAIRQLRGIAAGRGYDILSEEADDGSMLLEQPRSGAARPFPIIATAQAEQGAARVKLEAKLPAGMLAGAGGARTELCAMLGALKGGAEGIAAAERSQGAVSSAGPVVIEALMLSQQISQEADTNAAVIPSRYQGKTFTIKGRVAYVTKDGGAYRIDYDIPRSTNDLALKFGKFRFLTQISCLAAKGQGAYALSLRTGQGIQLTGQYKDYDHARQVMWFEGCRPAG